MKRTKLVVVVLLGLVLGLTLSAALGVYAQGGGDDERQSESQGGVSGEGLNDPPPDGMSILYGFTGARHDTAAGHEVATVVHCTNYGTEDAQTTVEIYNYNDADARTLSGTYLIKPNYTRTFATHDTQLYLEDRIMTHGGVAGPIDQGSGRVMSDRRTLICTAQVLDYNHALPWFAVKLPLYYPDGTQVGVYYLGATYLPVIVRQ